MHRNKKKILFIIQKRCHGGSTIHLLNIAQRLKEKYTVAAASAYATSWKDIIFSSPSKTTIRENTEGVLIYQMGFSLLIKLMVLFLLPLLFILRIFSKNKYRDIIVRLISIGYKNEVKKLSENFDIVYALKAQLPHFLLAFQKYSTRTFILSPLIHTMDSWCDSLEAMRLYNNSDKLLVSTEHEKNWLIKQEIEADKISVVGLGLFLDIDIKSNAQEFRNKYNLNGNIVLFIGRQRFQKNDKGWPELLKATSLVWKKHPQTTFVFMGSQSKEVKIYFESYKDSRILNLGKVTEQEKINALSACDIFAMPSASESFGETFLEAWYFKKPVIGANIEVSKEIIENNKCGFVAQKNSRILAKKIITFLDNPILQKRLGENGHQKLFNKYNWSKIILNINNIIRISNKP